MAYSSLRLNVSDCRQIIRLGQKIRTNGNGMERGDWIEGVVGEINDSSFFVWQNNVKGDVGAVSPERAGFRYSWLVRFANPRAIIDFIGDSDEILKEATATRGYRSPQYLADYYKIDECADECVEECKLEEKPMNKLNIFQNLLLDADTKTLRKADYLDYEMNLTSEGKRALDSLVFQAYKADLVKMAQAKLDEEKAEK
jgi:hypothetical protein